MNPSTASTQPLIQKSPFGGPKVFLIGPQGTGKTTSLRTLLKVPGIKHIRALFTEPRYDVLGKDVLDKIDWAYIGTVPKKMVGKNHWQVLESVAKSINVMGNDKLQGMNKMEAPSYTQWMEVIAMMNDFRDSKGRSHGDVSKWGTDTVLWLDSWSGLTEMATTLQSGAKPLLTQPDYGVIMRHLKHFLDVLITTTTCSVIITGHIEMEPTPEGGMKYMISTIGKKLAPTLGINFSDVIRTKRVGTQFLWDTADTNSDLKHSNLPLSSTIEPDFTRLFDTWQQKGGIFTPAWEIGG